MAEEGRGCSPRRRPGHGAVRLRFQQDATPAPTLAPAFAFRSAHLLSAWGMIHFICLLAARSRPLAFLQKGRCLSSSKKHCKRQHMGKCPLLFSCTVTILLFVSRIRVGNDDGNSRESQHSSVLPEMALETLQCQQGMRTGLFLESQGAPPHPSTACQGTPRIHDGGPGSCP